MRKFQFTIILMCIVSMLFGQEIDTSLISSDLLKTPKVKEEWKDFVIENSIPLKSLDSDDFSDLQFLKEILADKSYIFLGESSHLVKEYNELKFRLIRFLSQELDFNTVVFESNIWDCYQLKLLKDKYSSKEILDQTIYGVWNTPTINNLIAYIIENNIEFAGFDIKPSAVKYDYYFEKNILSTIDTNISNLALICGKGFLKADDYRNHTENKNELNQLLSDNEKLYDTLSQIIKDADLDLSLNLKIYQKEIKNRINRINSMINEDPEHSQDLRDSLMAETVEWLIKEVYPSKKIIFWGHNGHISKNNRKDEKSMGFMLPDSILRKSYIIGLYMFRGKTYSNRIIEIRKPYKNSLEAIMIQPHYKYSFLDFSEVKYSVGSSWIYQEIPSLLWGRFKENITLNKTYDAIILIDKSSLPNHLILDYY